MVFCLWFFRSGCSAAQDMNCAKKRQASTLLWPSKGSSLFMLDLTVEAGEFACKAAVRSATCLVRACTSSSVVMGSDILGGGGGIGSTVIGLSVISTGAVGVIGAGGAVGFTMIGNGGRLEEKAAGTELCSRGSKRPLLWFKSRGRGILAVLKILGQG